MKCQHDGCNREASHAPKLNVPATGWPIESHSPIGILFGLQVCVRHFEQLTVAEMLTPEIKNIVEIGARGRCPPDFARAFLSRVRLDSSEWLTFERAEAGRLN